MTIDPFLFAMYFGSGALAAWLYNRGTDKNDEVIKVISYFVAGTTALTWFTWSGPYIVISGMETMFGAALSYALTKKDTK